MPNWFSRRKTPRSASAQPTSQPAIRTREIQLERRHREDVPYALPKDLEEGQRLNLQRYIFRYSLRGNYAAPLPETVTTILDVGSGTGIWGQEMAQLSRRRVSLDSIWSPPVDLAVRFSDAAPSQLSLYSGQFAGRAAFS